MSTREPSANLTAELDRLSLEQALVDTELANARVIDLTRRLQEAHTEVEALRRHLDGVERGELEQLRTERDELAAFKGRLQGSLPYKLVSRALSVPGAARVKELLRG